MPKCAFHFNNFAYGRHGISDITSRMVSALQFALAFDCALIPPRPAEALTPEHNRGEEIDSRTWWTRYYSVGPGLNLSNGWEQL